MANYVIGDLQGHYDALCRLLEKIKYCPSTDALYFTGDLVNRGPQSLETLRFLKTLKPNPKIALGNHDVYLLSLIYGKQAQRVPDCLSNILKAPDKEELGQWLKSQGFLHECPQTHAIIVHAGIAPNWSLSKAKILAQELLDICQTETFMTWMHHYFDKRTNEWQDDLSGIARYQVAADYFTRMRFTDYHGALNWANAYDLGQTPPQCYPWFACPSRYEWQQPIVFGHWAALNGKTGFKNIQCVDTGLNWGGTLTALNLNNLMRFSTF